MSSLLAEKKLYLFLLSIIFLSASIFGNESIPIKALISDFNIGELINLYNSSDEFFRSPNTSLRITLFALGVLIFLSSLLSKSRNKLKNSKTFHILINLTLFIFFVSILISQNIYNISAIILILISLFYAVFFSYKKLHIYEIRLLSSYFLFFAYPFWSSTFHDTSLSELDNYLRFLLAIPIYLSIREVPISKNFLILSFMIGSLLSGIIAIYFFVNTNLSIRAFTSSASIFGAISLIFLLFTICSKNYFDSNFPKIRYLFYFSTIFGLIAIFLSGSRSLLLPLSIFVLALYFSKSKILDFNKVTLTSSILSIVLIFLFSNLPIMNRIINSYESTYNYITEGSEHYYLHQDSIVPRANIWKATINMIKTDPINGIGLNNFTQGLNEQIRANQIQPIKRDSNNPSAGMNHAHNQYLDIFVKTGFMGFVLLLYLLYSHFSFFRYSYDNLYSESNLISILGLVALFSFCIIMLFNTILSHQQLTLFMVITLVTLCGIKSNILWGKDN